MLIPGAGVSYNPCMPVLCRLATDGTGRVLAVEALPAGGGVLGRAADADVFVDGNDVSRHHARVVPVAGGGWLIEELGTTNGVWVDGQRVDRAMLRDGAMLRIASVGFRFNLADPRAASTVYTEGMPSPLAAMQSGSAPVPAAAPAPTPAPVPASQSYAPSVSAERERGSSAGLVLGIAGVLVAGGLVAGAWYVKRGSSATMPDEPVGSGGADETGDDGALADAPPESTAPAPTPENVAAVKIGADGGTIRFTDVRPELKGVSIVVPNGALASDLELTVAKVEPAAPSFSAGAGKDPALAALADRMASPPAQFALANARFASGAIDLGPSGTRFTTPVEVRIPLSDFGVDPKELPLPVLRGADGKWAFVEDYRVEDGLLIAKVPHFSLLAILVIGGAALSALGVVVVDQYALPKSSGFIHKTAYAWLASTPKEVPGLVSRLDATYGDAFARAATCAGVNLNTPAGSTPSSNIAFGWALGMSDGMGEIPRRGQKPLDDWVRDQFKVQYELEKMGGTPVKQALTLPLLFGKAVEFEGGNAFYALTSAHGMLAVGREVPPFIFMFQDYGPGLVKDQKGGRYHFFGMAAYGFTFASNDDAGWLEKLASPENVALFEEAGISQDYWKEPDEFALDVHGAAMGRRIYRELRSASQSSLKGRFPDVAAECDLEAKGDLIIPQLPAKDTSIEEKSVTLRFDGIGGEVEGALRIRGSADFDEGRKSGPSKCSIRVDITFDLDGTYDPEGKRMAGLARISKQTPPKVDFNGTCWKDAKEQLAKANLDELAIAWYGERNGQRVHGRFEVPGKKGQSADFETTIAAGN